ncbi:FUSC family protein [Streptomyces sp. NPDC090077]|uniref:FUSC family protein n=1 Tax=Streptomyces sp. NPDC090077 TaxID=3365938 RepID=UPI00380C1AAD
MLREEGPGAARVVVTVVVAWQVALWLGADQPPVYAAVVPLVALRGDPVSALGASVQRSLGVVAGVLIGIAVVNWLRPSTAALAVVVALGLVVGMFLRAGGGLNVQVAASSLLVFASTSPEAYAWHRVWETVAGAVVTVLLAPLLWPPDPYRTLGGIAEDCRVRVTRALAGTAAVVGGEAGAARDNLVVVREHAGAVHEGAVRAGEAERAMRFNPVRWRHREGVRVRARGIEAVDRAAGELVVLAGEVVAFTGREGIARAPLAELAPLVVRVVEDTLSGADPGPAAGAARAALADYARTDSSPVAVALRRPLARILDDLGTPSGG